MLRYQRLANSLYAYTNNLQIQTNVDFTNPEHEIITGYMKVAAVSGESYDRRLYFVANNASENLMTASKSFVVSASNQVASVSKLPTISSRVVGNSTYYGFLASNLRVCGILGVQASYSGSDAKFYLAPYKITVTYLEYGSNEIKTSTFTSSVEELKQVSKASTTSDSRTRLLIITCGLAANDLVLNINFEDYPVVQNEEEQIPETEPQDGPELVAPDVETPGGGADN